MIWWSCFLRMVWYIFIFSALRTSGRSLTARVDSIEERLIFVCFAAFVAGSMVSLAVCTIGVSLGTVQLCSL